MIQHETTTTQILPGTNEAALVQKFFDQEYKWSEAIQQGKLFIYRSPGQDAMVYRYTQSPYGRLQDHKVLALEPGSHSPSRKSWRTDPFDPTATEGLRLASVPHINLQDASGPANKASEKKPHVTYSVGLRHYTPTQYQACAGNEGIIHARMHHWQDNTYSIDRLIFYCKGVAHPCALPDEKINGGLIPDEKLLQKIKTSKTFTIYPPKTPDKKMSVLASPRTTHGTPPPAPSSKSAKAAKNAPRQKGISVPPAFKFPSVAPAL